MDALLKGNRLSGVWYDRTAAYEARCRGEEPSPGEFATRYEVPLEPLPCFEHLGAEQRRERIGEMVLDIRRETQARLGREGKRVLGVRRVLKQDPHRRPDRLKRSPAPRCHMTKREKWKEFRDGYRWFVSLYRAASARLRRGDLGARFR